MKKNFKYFVITWIIGFVLFNAITFLIPNEVFGVTRFDKGIFWIAYALITLSFIAQIITAHKFIKDDSNEKMFLNIPLLRTGYIAIIVSIIVGLIFMIFPVIPTWIGAIVCLLIAGCFVIACVNASTVANVVHDIDIKVKTKTFFIKSLTVDADTLMASAKSDAVKAECRKVYEAIRYSDPMSNDALSSVESQITIKFAELTEAVKEDNAERVVELVNEVVFLVGDRNKKCKLLR